VTLDPHALGTVVITAVDRGHALEALACPTVSQCSAVDDAGREVTFDPGHPAAARATALVQSYLSAIACPSVAQCTAVSYEEQAITFDPAAPGRPEPVGLGLGQDDLLTGISCPSVGRCTAVDFDGNEVAFAPAGRCREEGQDRR
jgi:hypothetical protein